MKIKYRRYFATYWVKSCSSHNPESNPLDTTPAAGQCEGGSFRCSRLGVHRQQEVAECGGCQRHHEHHEDLHLRVLTFEYPPLGLGLGLDLGLGLRLSLGLGLFGVEDVEREAERQAKHQ